jgi:hypothetical protein
MHQVAALITSDNSIRIRISSASFLDCLAKIRQVDLHRSGGASGL